MKEPRTDTELMTDLYMKVLFEKEQITQLGIEIIEKHNGYINFLTAKNLADQKEENQ